MWGFESLRSYQGFGDVVELAYTLFSKSSA